METGVRIQLAADSPATMLGTSRQQAVRRLEVGGQPPSQRLRRAKEVGDQRTEDPRFRMQDGRCKMQDTLISG